MELTAQIPDVTVGRAANAPHYEYMTTFGKRTTELPIDHELWRKGKDEFDAAFKAEDEAFKCYRDSELTDPLKAANEERDKVIFHTTFLTTAQNNSYKQLITQTCFFINIQPKSKKNRTFA